jgi:hypothetical protein
LNKKTLTNKNQRLQASKQKNQQLPTSNKSQRLQASNKSQQINVFKLACVACSYFL